jgi:hypothetical protein
VLEKSVKEPNRSHMTRFKSNRDKVRLIFRFGGDTSLRGFGFGLIAGAKYLTKSLSSTNALELESENMIIENDN